MPLRTQKTRCTISVTGPLLAAPTRVSAGEDASEFFARSHGPPWERLPCRSCGDSPKAKCGVVGCFGSTTSHFTAFLPEDRKGSALHRRTGVTSQISHPHFLPFRKNLRFPSCYFYSDSPSTRHPTSLSARRQSLWRHQRAVVKRSNAHSCRRGCQRVFRSFPRSPVGMPTLPLQRRFAEGERRGSGVFWIDHQSLHRVSPGGPV